MIKSPASEGWSPLARQMGVNIFGAGQFARDLAVALQSEGLLVHALLTTGKPVEAEWQRIPIRQIDARALSDFPVLIGVFNREPHSDYSAVQNQLLGINPAAVLVWPQTYYGELASRLGWRFWLHPLSAYTTVEDALEETRRLLEDERSRCALDQLVDFRRLYDGKVMSPSPYDEMQYLPDWMRPHLVRPLRMVDAGAYQGETLHQISRQVAVEQAWTFEPDPSNYRALVAVESDRGFPVTNVPAGLSDRTGMLGFTIGHGEASTLSDEGSLQVPVVALDDCIHLADVNFVKFDVEGNEIAALEGAVNTISRCRPVLAIAGYHRWDDLWRIPKFIHDLNLNYRIRIGLHGHNSFDTVFYAY